MTFLTTRDTWLSSIDSEKYGNNGGSTRLKLKGQQEYFLIDFDLSSLKGKIISGALLHLCVTNPETFPLMRIGVSSLASEWIEGNSKNYKEQIGSSCYVQSSYKKKDWAYPGSTLMDVCFGRGHTIWKFADASVPDKEGWQAVAIDPDVVSVRIAELSKGFVVYDEVGSTWSYKKGKFDFHYFPNRFCFSKESGKRSPWLELYIEKEDLLAPGPVEAIRVDTQDLPPGEAVISWKTPMDKGGGKVIGFHATYSIAGTEKKIPRYLVPMAKASGKEVRMLITDMGITGGQEIDLCIKSVDSAGNVGKSFKQRVRMSSNPCPISMEKNAPYVFPPDKNRPVIGDLKVSVVDLLDKIDPRTGKMIPEQIEGYKGGNHIFSSREKMIRLHGSRNEHVTFQLNIEGQTKKSSVHYSFNDSPGLRPKIYEFGYVKVKPSIGQDFKPLILPDPLVLSDGTFSIPSTAGKVRITRQTNHSLVLEVYIPHDEIPGKKKGRVLIYSNGNVLELNVELAVWDFTLPNALSFIPEMNAYSVVNPFKGYEYYRLAHEHRTCLNRLPYSWSGEPEFSPAWDGKGFNWDRWDEKVGPLLDGSAFKDLPRKGEPVDVLYLPLNENWPVNIFEHYTPSYWADEAFSLEYQTMLKKVYEDFAVHCDEKRWHNTIFQFYLNNKIQYRRKYDRCSAPWSFDEPVNTQDFWALRWFGSLWHSAVGSAKGKTNMWYRGDISYSQFERNILQGVMNIEYIGNNNDQKTQMLQEKQLFNGNSCFSEYGTPNSIDTPNIQPVLWCLSVWLKGGFGVMPWQTIGSKDSWKNGMTTSLFYPALNSNLSNIVPSVRLKSFTRGQQLVEYLMMFCRSLNVSRYEIDQWLKKEIGLLGDCGNRNAFLPSKQRSLQDLWRLRYKIGAYLSSASPPYNRSLVERKIFHSDKVELPDIGYVNPSPQVIRYAPDCDSFSPR